MRSTVLLAMADRLVVVFGDGTSTEHLRGTAVSCLVVASGRAYAGTDGGEVWRSDDGARSWRPLSARFRDGAVTAVAAGAEGDLLYVGTEPSRVFRSDDGGETSRELTGLDELPSATQWSFPPRPDTHHVRWIELDPSVPGRLFVAIEAGALIRSPDGGRIWQDRTAGSPYDTHTLATHPRAPGRLYAAAGDGYFESRDAGDTWSRPRRGLRHTYLVGVAVHPLDPEQILVSAAPGPWTAYRAAGAESYLYRRRGSGAWEATSDGLPDPRGTTVSALAGSVAEPGVAYAANNRGLFRSTDFGVRWERLEVFWPATRGVRSLALLEPFS